MVFKTGHLKGSMIESLLILTPVLFLRFLIVGFYFLLHFHFLLFLLCYGLHIKDYSCERIQQKLEASNQTNDSLMVPSLFVIHWHWAMRTERTEVTSRALSSMQCDRNSLRGCFFGVAAHIYSRMKADIEDEGSIWGIQPYLH